MCDDCSVVLFFTRLPSNDGNASKGKQQTTEPVHILKRSFARTVSVVSCVAVLWIALSHSPLMHLASLSISVSVCRSVLSPCSVSCTGAGPPWSWVWKSCEDWRVSSTQPPCSTWSGCALLAHAAFACSGSTSVRSSPSLVRTQKYRKRHQLLYKAVVAAKRNPWWCYWILLYVVNVFQCRSISSCLLIRKRNNTGPAKCFMSQL